MDAAFLQALGRLTDPTHREAALASLAALTAAPQTDEADRRALHQARLRFMSDGEAELARCLLEIEIASVQDDAQRADLLFQKGDLEESELLRPQAALATYEAAIRLAPYALRMKEKRTRLLLVQQHWQKVFDHYLADAQASSHAELGSALYQSAAELVLKHSPTEQSPTGEAADDTAVECLERAVELDRGNRAAFRRLAAVLDRRGQRAKLLELYRRRLETAANPERAGLLSVLGGLTEREKGIEAALPLYEELIAKYADEVGVAQAAEVLARHYRAAENWPALCKTLEIQLGAASDDRAPAILAELGQLNAQRLDNPGAAAECFKRLRRLSPAHPAVIEHARAELKQNPAELFQQLSVAHRMSADVEERNRLALELAALGETLPEMRDKAIALWKGVYQRARLPEGAAALRRLYQAGEKWNALLELLKEELATLAENDHDGRWVLYEEIVSVYRDRLKLDAMVLSTYNQMLTLRPDDKTTLGALSERYEALGRSSDLIATLERLAAVENDRSIKAALLGRVSGLWIGKFSNYQQALRPLEELYTLKPDRAVADQLRDLYTRRRAWRALLELERKEIAYLPTPAEQRQKLVTMAQLSLERLGDVSEAIKIWNEVLGLNRSDAQALEALTLLCERDKRWSELLEVLRARLRVTSEVPAQVALLEKIASLCKDRLNDVESTVAAQQEIVRLQPGVQKPLRTLRELYALHGKFAELEKLYAEHRQWDELCDVLFGVAERLHDPTRRLTLYGRVAEIAHHELKSTERAVKVYERILSVDPINRAAAAALAPIYRASEKWARVVDLYEVLLEHAESVVDKLALCAEIRVLCEEKIGNRTLALTWCARACVLAPGDRGLERNLERLVAATDNYAELDRVYRQTLPALSKPEQAARLLQIGCNALERLHRVDEAKVDFAALLDLRPEPRLERQALAALAEIHVRERSLTELAEVYRRLVPLTESEAERIEFQSKLAQAEEQAGDRARAKVTYGQLVAQGRRVERHAALSALERLHAEDQEWAALSEILQLQKSEAAPSERAELDARLGELYRVRIGDETRALQHFRAAFTAGVHTEAVLQALAQLGQSPTLDLELRRPVAALVLPHFQTLSNDEAVAVVSRLLAVRLERALPEEREPLLRQLLWHQLERVHDEKAAFAVGCELFAQVPGDESHRRSMQGLAAGLGAEARIVWARALETGETVALERTPALAKELGCEAAVLYETLADGLAAEAAWRRVLSHAPDEERAQVALVRLLGATDRSGELGSYLEAELGRATTDERRKQLLGQLCDLDDRSTSGSSSTTAQLHYETLLQLEPDSDRAFLALNNLYTQAEAWPKLDELFETRLANIHDAPLRASLLRRRGDLQANRLGYKARAVDLYEQAFEVGDPNDSADSESGLEALLADSGLRSRVARLLERMYAKKESWKKVVDMLVLAREGETGSAAAVLLGRLADVQEQRLGARQLALATWREALRQDPSWEVGWQQVERLGRMLDRPADLAAAYEEAVGRLEEQDTGLACALLEKAAALHENEMGDRARATLVWRRLQQVGSDRPASVRAAVIALGRLYEADGNLAEFAAMLQQQAESAEDRIERRTVLERLARLREEALGDAAAAIGTWTQILDDSADDTVALCELDRLHAATGNFAGVIAVLQRRVVLVDGKERRDLLWRIADITENKLGHRDDAIAAYQAVLDEFPADLEVLDSLERLFASSNRIADQMDVLERRLACMPGALESGDQTETWRLRLRIATLLIGEQQADAALAHLRIVLKNHPANVDARTLCESLLDDGQVFLGAAELLEPLYRLDSNTDRLAQIAELWSAHGPDGRERTRRLLELARYKEQAGYIGAALSALDRAARAMVGEPELGLVLDELERVGAGATDELLTLYREIGPEVLDPILQMRIHFFVADAALRSENFTLARNYYRRVLDAAPDSRRAVGALEALAEKEGDDVARLEMLQRQVELDESDEDKRQHLVTLAELCTGSLGRPDDAAVAYEAILALYPGDRLAFSALEKYYRDTAKFHELGDLYERQLGFADELAEAVALRVGLGKLSAQELGDHTRAIENFRAALSGNAEEPTALAALEKYLDSEAERTAAAEVLEPIYIAHHNWRALVRLYGLRLDFSGGSERLILIRKIACLYEEQLEDLETAFQWYGRLFVEGDGDWQGREQLVRLSSVLSCWRELGQVFERFLAEPRDGSSASKMLRSLATLYETRMGDEAAACGAYERLSELEPSDDNTFSSRERLYQKLGRSAELGRLYEHHAELVEDPVRQRELLLQSAAVVLDALGDRERAIDLYRRAHDLDVGSDDPRARRALDRLYSESGDWVSLVALLSTELEHATGAAALAIKLRLGRLSDDKLRDRAQALMLFQEVLTADPDNVEALTALEERIVDAEHTLTVARFLEPIYRSRDAWQKLVVVLEAKLGAAEDLSERLQLLSEIARLHEERGKDGKRAFRALGRALREVLAAADRVAEVAYYEWARDVAGEYQMWSELATLLASVADSVLDDELYERVLSRLGEVVERQLDDRSRAIVCFERLTERLPDLERAWVERERLLELEQRLPELLLTLEQHSERTADPSAQRELFARAARLAMNLGENGRAEGLWQRVLGLEDQNREALEALAALFHTRGAHADWANVVVRLNGMSTTGEERLERSRALAEVYEQKLGERARAIEVYREMLADVPSDERVLRHLARLYAEESDSVSRVEMLDILSAVPGLSLHDSLATAMQAALVFEEKIGERETALDRYRNILTQTGLGKARDPELADVRAGARDALERLAHLEDVDLARPAIAVLELFYDGVDDRGALVRLSELRLQSELERPERLELFRRIATLEESRGDVQAAFLAQRRSVLEQYDPATVAELERLSRSGLERQLVTLFKELLDATLEPSVSHVVAKKLGAGCEAIGDDDAAVLAFARALECATEDGAQSEALIALERLQRRRGRLDEFDPVLERTAEATRDEQTQAQRFCQLGQLRLRELGRAAAARVAFQAALERAPQDAQARASLEEVARSAPSEIDAALSVLEPLYESEHNLTKLRELTELRLHNASVAERSALHRRSAELSESLGDEVAALLSLSAALELEPNDERLCDEVERLAAMAQESTDVAALFERLSERPDCQDVPTLKVRAAKQWLLAGDELHAEACLQPVLQSTDFAGRSETLHLLEGIYRRRKSTPLLVPILLARADIELDEPAKKELYREVAARAANDLGDKELAVAALRQVLAVDESDLQAIDALLWFLSDLAISRNHAPSERVELYERKARLSSSTELQLEIKFEIAQLWVEAGELGHAADSYREAADLAPTSMAPLEALERIERQRGERDSVREALTRQLEIASGSARLAVTRRLVEWALEANTLEDAIGYLNDLLSTDSENEWALDQLESIYERSERWHDLVDLLTTRCKRAQQRADAAGELALLMRTAEVWETQLQNPSGARELWLRVLERDPKSGGALLGLARILEEENELGEARLLLERALPLCTTQAEQANLYFRMGRLAALEAGEDAALPFYEQAWTLDPGHTQALQALEEDARQREDFARLSVLIESKAAQASGGARIALLSECADLCFEKLHDAPRALQLLATANRELPDSGLEGAPSPVVLKERLADLAFANRHFDEALTLYEWLAAQKGRRPKEIGRLQTRIGAIALEVGDRPRAVAAFGAAYQADPVFPPTLVALGRLHLEEGDLEKARRMYRALLLQNLDASSGVNKAEVYFCLGEIHERSNETPKAVAMYERGLEIEPAHEALRAALARLKAK